MTSARIAIDAGDHLGEGPFWDERREELLRVDITRGHVHGWNPESGATWRRAYPGDVSAVVPLSADAGYVLACNHQILLQAEDGIDVLARVEEDRPGNRFNDCKCDPQGRLWAGTMSKDRVPGTAGLYRLTRDGDLTQVLPGTTLSNGLAWSPSGDRMYFIDSTTQRVDVFDFDAGAGEIADRRRFAEIEVSAGLPDGMTVDADGGVWVCLFGGGSIRRYDPEGTLDAVVHLPVTNPTSPVFGGHDLRTLYITTARHRLSPEQLALEPLAGAVLALEPGVSGIPGNRFGRTELPGAGGCSG